MTYITIKGNENVKKAVQDYSDANSPSLPPGRVGEFSIPSEMVSSPNPGPGMLARGSSSAILRSKLGAGPEAQLAAAPTASLALRTSETRRLRPDEVVSEYGHRLAGRVKPPEWIPWYEDLLKQFFTWRGYNEKEVAVLVKIPRMTWGYESVYDFSAVNWGPDYTDGDARGIGQWRVSSWNGIRFSNKLRKFFESSGIITSILKHPSFRLSTNQTTILRSFDWPWTSVQKDLKHIASKMLSSKDAATTAEYQVMRTKLMDQVSFDLRTYGLPAYQLLAAMPFIDDIWSFASKSWKWNAVDNKWIYSGSLNPNIAAAYPAAFNDFYTGMALIIFIGYGDGIGYYNRKLALNHGGSSYAPDRYATIVRDSLKDVSVVV